MVAAQRQLFVELTAALGEGNITLAKETSGAPANDWQVANAAMTSDTFCSQYCHQCNDSITPASRWAVPADAQQCADSIATIANMSARGQLTQVHVHALISLPAINTVTSLVSRLHAHAESRHGAIQWHCR